MITFAEAQRIARDYMRTEWPKSDFVITVNYERPFGWAFCYQSREWVETGAINALLAGNGPLLVLRANGSVVMLWSGASVEDQLDDYAKSHGLEGHARMPPADDTERRLNLLRLASGGKLDGLPCPECLQAAVSVWYTNPFPGEYRTWFLCQGCAFRVRAQNSGKPEHFATDRVDPDLQREDQR